MTTYVVLTSNNGGGWKEVARVEAGGDVAAIRQVVDGKTSEGEYVAIPERSFRPRAVVTKTVVAFEAVAR